MTRERRACSCSTLRLRLSSKPKPKLNRNPKPSLPPTQASLQLLVDGKLLHTFAGPSSGWPKQPLMLPSSSIALRFRAARAPTGRKARASA